MSGATVADFLGYWEREGEAYVRHGDYDWMAGLVPGRRVLEIGCGVGHSTQALLRRGLSVLAVDSLPACLDATRRSCCRPTWPDSTTASAPGLPPSRRMSSSAG